MRMSKIQRPVEFKDIAGGEMQATNDSQGIVEGYLNRTSIIDFVGDKSLPGCFAVTVKDAYTRKASQSLDYLWPFLWSHNFEILPPGGIFYAEEDRKGLYIKVQLNRDIQSGAELYSSFRAGTVSKLSMGYKAIRSDWTKIEGKQIRLLQEVAVLEGSAVTFPANDLSQVTAIKSGGSSMFTRMRSSKDFDSRYAAQTLDDWAYADWYDLSTALKQSIMDLFAPGGDPVADLESQVIPGLLQALRQYVSEGVDLGYTGDSSNGMDMDMMSMAGGFSEKSGYLTANAHATIKEASTAIMKHAKAIQKVSQDLEASRSRGLQGVPNALASNRSYFEQKEAEANMDAQLKLLNTRLEVDSALREGREALTESMPGPTAGVDRALRQLLSKLA